MFVNFFQKVGKECDYTTCRWDTPIQDEQKPNRDRNHDFNRFLKKISLL